MTLLLNWRVWVALALAVLLAFSHLTAYRAGKHATQLAWDASTAKQADEALRESQAKAKETFRRMEAQDANQREQNRQLAQARADAERNRADADRVREQAATAARDWAARLADSPTGSDLQAAGAAIAVCADVRGRLDAAAGQLAEFADASRAAGLKCERDYRALTPPGAK